MANDASETHLVTHIFSLFEWEEERFIYPTHNKSTFNNILDAVNRFLITERLWKILLSWTAVTRLASEQVLQRLPCYCHSTGKPTVIEIHDENGKIHIGKVDHKLCQFCNAVEMKFFQNCISNIQPFKYLLGDRGTLERCTLENHHDAFIKIEIIHTQVAKHRQKKLPGGID